jgi:hypothetical protein
MNWLDVFNQDFFNVVSLTGSLNRLPFVPARLGRLGLFSAVPITTTTAVFEEQYGRISLLQSKPRGSGETQTGSKARRKVRALPVPHIPTMDQILADDVQGVRAFGEETATEVFTTIVNNRLELRRQDHEVTAEYHRAGAIQGIVLDADGTELANMFTLFGVAEQTQAITMTGDTGATKTSILAAVRKLRNALGADSYNGIHAMCGDTFFDTLVAAPEVRASYLRYQENEFARTQQGSNEVGFTWGGVTWENYRGKVGATDFIPANQARLFPLGVPQLFQVMYAPADYIETVNTNGKPFYAKQARLKFDKGIELETQSNPLHVCTRPAVLVKATIA